MRELKYKKSLWWSLSALGILITAGSLALFVIRILHNAILPGVVLLSAAVGGGLLTFQGLRALSDLKELRPEQDIRTGPRSEREQALATMEHLKVGVSRRFSKVLSIVILILSAAVFLWAYGEAQTTESIPQSASVTGMKFEKGVVISIDDSQYQGQQDVEDVPVGKQVVTVELTSGDYAGNRYQLTNNLSYLYGTVLEEGDHVTVSVSMVDGVAYEILLQDYDRTMPLFWIVLIFFVITVLVGGKVGAKSLLGLGLTILCVFSVLIPMLLGGWPTLPTILGLCAFVTVVEFVILDGVNKKTVCAILGTISGVLFAQLFGQFACKLLRINGFLMYSAESAIEALLQIKQGQDPFHSLQIGDLLVGGILIAALGAVNDVAMSISSSMNELIAVNPDLSRRKLFKSGMNIGRDMVGTMTNTLILALVGSSLVMMIFLSSLEPSFQQLMSTTFLSVEMVQMLASSIGVILAVPMSVLLGTLLFGHRKRIEK